MIRDDGHPMSYGSLATRLTGRYGGYSLVSTTEGIVLKAYYPDDEASVSKKFMEYDVLLVSTKTVLPHVRRLLTMGGCNDGDDPVLRETTGIANSAQSDDPSWITRNLATDKMNGDRVAIGFFNGSQDTPFIYGVLPHPATTYSGTRDKGRRRFIQHQGATAQIDKNGNVVVTFPDGKQMNISSKNVTLKLDDNADVAEINGNDWSALKTEDLLSALASLLTDLNTGFVAGVTTPAGPGTLTNIANITKALLDLQLKLKDGKTFISTHVKYG